MHLEQILTYLLATCLAVLLLGIGWSIPYHLLRLGVRNMYRSDRSLCWRRALVELGAVGKLLAGLLLLPSLIALAAAAVIVLVHHRIAPVPELVSKLEALPGRAVASSDSQEMPARAATLLTSAAAPLGQAADASSLGSRASAWGFWLTGGGGLLLLVGYRLFIKSYLITLAGYQRGVHSRARQYQQFDLQRG